jgi:hypothetical protein
MTVSGDLQQAQFRQIRVFRNEFRIEGDDFRGCNHLAEIAQVLMGSNVFVPHASPLLASDPPDKRFLCPRTVI